MVRITTQRQPSGPTTLVVEGRLAGPWVEALRLEAGAVGPALALDLTGLAHADPAGVTLLRGLLAAGARLVGSNAYATALLEGA